MGRLQKKLICKLLATSGLLFVGINFASVAQADADLFSTHPRFYADIGVETYSVNLPTYRLPITFGDWVAVGLPPVGLDEGFNANNTQAGNTATVGKLNLGYYFKSPVFSNYLDREAIELDYSQFNRATKDLRAYSGATGEDAGAAHGIIWRINNPTDPIYGGGAERIVSSYIHASVHYHEADLFLKTNIKNLPNRFHSTAKVGFVFTALDQFYSYNISSTTQGGIHDPIETLGDDSLRARYSGLAIGDRLEFQIAPAFTLFVDGTIQGLYARSYLTANQTPDAIAPDCTGCFADYRENIRITDSKHAMTYRAQATAGVNFFPKLISGNEFLYVSLYAGVDQWGYVPQAVTITTAGASLPHIEAQTMRNFFAGVNLTVPIG